jgi:hypothetical protein
MGKVECPMRSTGYIESFLDASNELPWEVYDESEV